MLLIGVLIDMFIWELMKDVYDFTNENLLQLFKHLDAYSKTPDGAWLKEVDYHYLDYVWGPNLENTDVQAGRPLFGDSIVAQPNRDNPDYWVSLIAPAICHELRHVWQRKKYGVIVYSVLITLGNLVYAINKDLYQKIALEADAFAQQDKIQKFIGGV